MTLPKTPLRIEFVELLKSVARPPLFPDEEKTQIARALHIILWTLDIVVSLILLTGLIFPIGSHFRWVAIAMFVYLLSAVLLFLNSRGKTRLSSWLLVVGLTLLITSHAYTAGGINDLSMFWYICIIFIAGLLLGGRVGVIIAGVCGVIALGFVILELNDQLPASSVTLSPITKWISFILLVMAVVSLQYISSVAIKTALRKTQEEVSRRRESEQLTRAIFDKTFEFVGLLKPDGILIEANNTALEFAGVTREEVLGKPSWDTPWWSHSEETKIRMKDAVQRAALGQMVRGEAKYISVDGAVRDIDFSLKPVFDDVGKVIFLIPEGRDITEMKRAEKALRERLKEITCFSQVNHAMNLQLSMDELCQKIVEYIIPAMQYPDNTVPLLTMDGKRYTSEKYHTALSCCLRSNIIVKGKVRGELWVYYTEDKDFLLPYEQGLIDSITQELGLWIGRNEAEEQARKQQLQLLQADKMTSLGVLISGVAHEINNPNNLVMFNNDLLMQFFNDVLPVLDEYYTAHPDQTLGGLSYEETRKEIESILNGVTIGAKRIRDIVHGLKEFARIDPGNLNQEIHINEVVRSALLIVGNLIRKSTDRFIVEYGDYVTPAMGNNQQIEQVIINLLTNACQSLPNRTHAIRLHTLYDKNEKRVKLIVSDEGVGISKEAMQRLFDPFYTTKRDQGGTGLGLSVSYNIVKAHEGDLIVESEENKGTTVTLSLPEKILQE